VKTYIDVDYASNLKRTNYYLNRIRKVAEEFKGKLLFAIAKRSDFKDEMSRFGVPETGEVGVAIDDHVNSAKHPMKDTFSVENLKKFAEDFLAKKLKSYIKSEPVPAGNDQPGKVKVVVGETLNDIVMDKNKDVFFEMYAPWCGHCKSLEPKYKELAEKMKDIPTVTIAKMDATANDSPHPKYQAKGYPTILFAPANSKDEPVAYSGDREVSAMYDWIKSTASLPFPKDAESDSGDKKDKPKKAKKDKKPKEDL